MKIKFIDGTIKSLDGENVSVYVLSGVIHYVLGCYVHKYEEGEYKKVYFKRTDTRLESNTIYIVRQKNKKDQFHTLIHELCHWLVSKIVNSKKLHSLIEKYIH